MNADILARIKLLLPALSRAEAQVAHWLLQHPREATSATLGQVAEHAQVSEPTIIRFCRSLGLSGFRELRTLLVVSQQHPESFLHQSVDASDGVDEATGKVLDTSIRALVNLRSIAAGMPFEAAVRAMAAARQLLFVGLGASGLVARDGAHKFFRLALPCAVATDIQTILQYAAIAQQGDVIIAISYSGTWSAMVETMALAQSNGATVIAITDPTAPLADLADYVFETHPVEDANVYTPMSSRLVQLALLDALQIALALVSGVEAEKNLKLSKDVLVEFRAAGHASSAAKTINAT